MGHQRRDERTEVLAVRRIAAVAVALAVALAAGLAVAQFAGVPLWDAAFEGEPLDTDSVGAGAEEIRTLKEGIRERMEVQHQFGDAEDTGFHKEGSAWAFYDADCAGEAPDADHEDGRLCVDTTDLSLWILDSVAAAYEAVNAVPQNAIILWTEVTGDENCDGTPGAGECPCGYDEDEAFRSLTIRGADMGGLDGHIPDDPGETCDGVGDPAGCNAAGNVNGMYDDTIEILQMPLHDHTIDTYTYRSTPGTKIFVDNIAANWLAETTWAVGGSDEHYHPFRTVMFCKKI